MSMSSSFGGRSNSRRYISEPTTRCSRPGLLSEHTSNFIIPDGHIRASTSRHRIRLTSTSTGYRMSQQRNYRIGIVGPRPHRVSPAKKGGFKLPKNSAKAVDLTLCVPQILDNADALPKCPQREQKTQPR